MSSTSNKPIELAVKDQSPTFSLEPVHLQFDLNGTLRKVLVQNNILYLIRTTVVSRIDLSRPSAVGNCPLPQTKSKLRDSWLHSNGKHLIVSFEDLTYWYLHISYQKFKPLTKLKGLRVAQLIFLSSKEDSTNDASLLLLTCNDGAVHLGHIKAHGSSQEGKRDDKHLKQVYKRSETYLGISISNNGTRITVLTTLQVLYWDCFELTFPELLSVFKLAPVSQSLPFDVSLRSVFRDSSEGWVIIDPGSNSLLYPAGSGTQTDQLPITKEDLSFDQSTITISKHHLLILNEKKLQINVINRLTSKVTTNISLEDIWLDAEPVIGLALDFLCSTFWVYTANSLLEIVVANESISVWYDYYKLGDFDQALKCINPSDPTAKIKIDFIHIKQGYDLLQKGLFGSPVLNEYPNTDAINLQIKGIRKLGDLNEPFEKVCLMLLNLQDPHNSANFRALNLSNTLLIEYLLTKFKAAKQQSNMVRLTVLSTWIVELMLRQLYTTEAAKNIAESPTTGVSDINSLNKELERITEQFHTFLRNNEKFLDLSSVYQILKDLCLSEQLVYFAELKQDFEFLVHYHIEMSDWDNALKNLVNLYISDKKVAQKCVYDTSTILLINSSKKTVDTWLKFDELKFEDLLPAIMVYNKNNQSMDYSENQTLKYMQKLIIERGRNDSLVNNSLLSLLITYPKRLNESELLLTKQLVRLLNQFKSDDHSSVSFDTDLILRLCLANSRYEAAIIVLINEKKLYFDAMQLALSVKSLEMSELILRKFEETTDSDEDFEKPKDSQENIDRIGLEYNSHVIKRDLWLQYAKYLIQEDGDRKLYKEIVTRSSASQESQPDKRDFKDDSDELRLKQILKYLLELSSRTDKIKVLTIKDLLPLFPKTILVNNFKEEIVESLNEYNLKISTLTTELDSSLITSKKLRSQVKDALLETKKGTIHTIIEPGEPCRLCNNLLVNKNFVCFPNCHHAFHKDCIARYFLQLRGDYQFKRIFLEFKKNSSLANREELDSLMTAECILCNSSIIDSIDNDLLADSPNVGLNWDL